MIGKMKVSKITLLFSCFTLFTTLPAQLPHLEHSGLVTKMIVNDKPFLMIGGEFHNSTSSSTGYMEDIDIWGTVEKANYNTIVASASWELVEPEEGKYSFGPVDYIINKAREKDLKVVLIWFASWKNGASTYVPGWVKRDQNNYRYVQNAKGETLDVLSPVANEKAMKADARAFAALMRHIKEVDPGHNVIMMQVENEVGILTSPKDFSPVAEKAWKSDVPADLIKYLQSHKGLLFPELEKVWEANGYKTKGSWEEVFGVSSKNTQNWQEYPYYTEELFMAYNYARYISHVAAEGKKELNLPMYCNAWLKQPSGGFPGKFPSGGPLPEVLDIWRAAGPAIDFLAPDIYIDDFDWVLSQFTLSGNPVFIPECTFDISKELYAFGKYNVLGFSPFGIDIKRGGFSMGPSDDSTVEDFYKGNAILRGMDQIILNHYGSDKMSGLLVDDVNSKQSARMGDYEISVTLAASSAQGTQNDGTGTGSRKLRKDGGALIIQAGEDEFYIVGKDIRIGYALAEKNSILNAVTELVEEGTFRDNKWIPGRRINGDETYFLRFNEVKCVRVKLFKSKYDNRIMF
jgi:hypothetical protein